MNVWLSILFIACGAFTILGAVNDRDWFMNSHKAHRFIDLFGRKGARIFYGLLGAFNIFIGIMLMLYN